MKMLFLRDFPPWLYKSVCFKWISWYMKLNPTVHKYTNSETLYYKISEKKKEGVDIHCKNSLHNQQSQIEWN